MAKVSITVDDLDKINATQRIVELAAGSTYVVKDTMVTKWDSNQVSSWLVSIGFNDLVPLFQRANINGMALTRLSNSTLHEIGVRNVGTRLQFINEILKIQAISRKEWRNHLIWVDEEYRENKCFYQLPYNFPLCCLETICSPKHAQYTLTNDNLRIEREIKVVTWCPQFCTPCLGKHILTNNIDLVHVVDVDCSAKTSTCGDPGGKVMVTSLTGEVDILKIRSSECQRVAALINITKEEAFIVARMHAPMIY